MIAVIKRLIRIGIISLAGSDDKNVPFQQIQYRGKSANGTAWYPYGFHAIAKENSYTLIVLPSANSEERVHIPTSMLDRPHGKSGDVFVFHPDTGAKIHFDSTGKITITGVADVAIVSPTKVTIDAPIIEDTGDETIDGTLDVTGIATVNTHLVVGGNLEVDGDLNHDGPNIGFRGSTPRTKQTITGSGAGGGSAMKNLLIELDALGIIADGT